MTTDCGHLPHYGLGLCRTCYQVVNLKRDRKAQAVSHRRTRKALAGIIRQHKIDSGCSDCGYSESAEALDLDHMPGSDKRFNVSQFSRSNRNLTQILEELAKCEVVCANCHRVRTARRAGRE